MASRSKNLYAILKKLWNDPVWSKVIAGAIPAGGISLATYFLNWWPAIGYFARNTYDYALSRTPLPNWLIGVLGLLSAHTIIALLATIWQKVFPSQPWRKYTTDKFLGLRWEWKYFSDGEIDDLRAFCPKCDFQLGIEDTNEYSYLCEIRCDNCGQDLSKFNNTYLDLEKKVIRLIEQKIRNRSGPRP